MCGVWERIKTLKQVSGQAFFVKRKASKHTDKTLPFDVTLLSVVNNTPPQKHTLVASSLHLYPFQTYFVPGIYLSPTIN